MCSSLRVFVYNLVNIEVERIYVSFVIEEINEYLEDNRIIGVFQVGKIFRQVSDTRYYDAVRIKNCTSHSNQSIDFRKIQIFSIEYEPIVRLHAATVWKYSNGRSRFMNYETGY